MESDGERGGVMGANTDNAMMSRTETRIIELLNRAKIARGDKTDGDDIAEILKALMPLLQAQTSNGTKTKVAGLASAFAIVLGIGAFLAVEVIAQGKELATIKAEVQQCIKVKP